MGSSVVTEVVVIGAGPAGLTAALALSALGIEVVIAAPAYDPTRAQADRRTTALLPSSIELLKNLGIWEDCEDQSAALEGVRIVDDRGGFLRAPEVLFKAQELGLPSFGSNVSNTVLNAALHARACAAEGLRWLPTSAVVKVEPGQESVRIELAEGRTIAAVLAVAADGRASIARTAAAIGTRSWSYAQTAIAATFRHSRPHAGVPRATPPSGAADDRTAPGTRRARLGG
jgi:2-octaprenyl-6-methoxyphenol hydroxylase